MLTIHFMCILVLRILLYAQFCLFVSISFAGHRFLLETDMVEEGIQEVYALASKYKELELKELQRIVNTNYKTVFDLAMKPIFFQSHANPNFLHIL